MYGSQMEVFTFIGLYNLCERKTIHETYSVKDLMEYT